MAQIVVHLLNSAFVDRLNVERLDRINALIGQQGINGGAVKHFGLRSIEYRVSAPTAEAAVGYHIQQRPIARRPIPAPPMST